MKEKISARFNEMCPVAARLLRGGLQFSCLILATALVLLMANKYSSSYSICGTALLTQLAEAGVTVAAEIIIASLLLDHFIKKRTE